MLWFQRQTMASPWTPATPPTIRGTSTNTTDDQKHEHEHVLHHRRTSSAPAPVRSDRTCSAVSGGQATATPKRSRVNRGSYVIDGLVCGSLPRRSIATKVARPPNRMVS